MTLLMRFPEMQLRAMRVFQDSKYFVAPADRYDI